MGQNLSVCCEEFFQKKNNTIPIPKEKLVQRKIYTLKECINDYHTEYEYNINDTVKNLKDLRINKSINICRKVGLPSEEYLILKELGEGSFGKVLKVVHKITNNIRAIKVIKKLNLEKDYNKSKLYDEIKILKETDHPNIIKIFEFFEDEENYYIVSEYCPEGDLADLLGKLNVFNEKFLKILLFQILSAVHYLHSKRIIHGDLKLENILIENLSLKNYLTNRSLSLNLEKNNNDSFTEKINLEETNRELEYSNSQTKEEINSLMNGLENQGSKFGTSISFKENNFNNSSHRDQAKSKFYQSENLDNFNKKLTTSNLNNIGQSFINDSIKLEEISSSARIENKIFGEIDLNGNENKLGRKSPGINLIHRKIQFFNFHKNQKAVKFYYNTNNYKETKNENHNNNFSDYATENLNINTNRDDFTKKYVYENQKNNGLFEIIPEKIEKYEGDILIEENLIDDNLLKMENILEKNYLNKSNKKPEKYDKINIPNLNLYNINNYQATNKNTELVLDKDKYSTSNSQKNNSIKIEENNTNSKIFNNFSDIKINNDKEIKEIEKDLSESRTDTDNGFSNRESLQNNFNKKINNNMTMTISNIDIYDTYREEINEEYILKNLLNYEIKLIDFGCSKIFRKGGKKFDDIIGTLFYIAPEVIRNNYNEKCDLWSIGVIMYFLLVGFPPFFSMSDTEVFAQILTADYSFDFPEFNGISDLAKDLITKLLEINPNKRLSARQALEHEFFEEISSNRLNDCNLDYSILNNLKKNKKEYKFQRAVLSYLAYNFASKDEIINLRKIFKSIDLNCDGKISKEELLYAFSKNNLEINENELNMIIDVIDMDKSGFIEYEEFITSMINKKKLLTETNLKSAFDLFDQDKSQKISMDEIKNILFGDRENISEDFTLELLNDINLGHDEEIDFEEFKNIIFQIVKDE